MGCLQAAIGTANDILDADADAEHKPRKPIPLGLVDPRVAAGVLVLSLALGLGLSAPSGLATFAVALLGTAVGLAYDLRLKGTAWSWAPFAVGIPLLPVFGWVGASGGAPPASLLFLVGLAVPAGAALACGNALGDLERDIATGTASVATALGRGRAWAVGAGLQGLVLTVALCAMAVGPADAWALLAAVGAGAVVAAGLGLGASDVPSRRERGWEVQAVGLAALAVVWFLALGPARGG